MIPDPELLKNLNLKKNVQDDILKNEAIKEKFFDAIQKANVNELTANQSLLFYELITQGKFIPNLDLTTLLTYIRDEKITSKV